MVQSQRYTVASAFKEAVMDLPKAKIGKVFRPMRLDLANRMQELVIGTMADIVAEAYIDDTALSVTGGNYSSASGTFTLATLHIAIAMHSSFVSGDIGKGIHFRIGTTVYNAKISGVIGVGEIAVSGAVLPGADGAVADLFVAAAPVSASATVDISSLNLLRYGNQLSWQIVSDATQSVNVMSRESFERFAPSAYQNLKMIIWCLVGTSIQFKQGDSLSNLGNMILRAPVLPKLLTADTDPLSLVDGPMCQIGIAVLRNLIAKRVDVQVDSKTHFLNEQIAALMRSFGNEVKEEEVKEKVTALVAP